MPDDDELDEDAEDEDAEDEDAEDEDAEDEDAEDEDRDVDADDEDPDRISLEDETTVQCPYCFESQLLVIDPETTGELVQDCDVCCNPWTVTVTRDHDGQMTVSVEPAS